MKAFCCLGKTGDVLSSLPLARREFDSSGKKPAFIISRQYSSILDRVDYVVPDVYDGPWGDLAGALKQYKRKYPRVIVPMTFGDNFPIEHRRPSFQLDAYERAGALDQWDRLPLVLSRDPDHEKRLLKKLGISRLPYALFADQSQSSPFPDAESLAAKLDHLLLLQAPKPIKLVRLSQLRMDNFADFLPVYDQARFLVSVETAHLHLSAASRVPVLALVTDKPQLWHGSAWSRRFRFHCRYSDFPARADELLRIVERILKQQPPLEIRPAQTLQPFGYNPSIIVDGNRTIGTYRYHPHPEKWRTELAGHDGEKSFRILVPDAIRDHSIEDGRLFHYRGALHISYVCSLFPAYPLRSIVAYGPLVKEGDDWRIANHLQPRMPTNNFSCLQKNWCFFEHDNSLYSIYTSVPEQIVLHLNGEQLVSELKSPGPKWDYGEIRGGAMVPYKGNFLRFFHSRTGDGAKHFEFRYHIGALVMEARPPFKVLQVSRYPILSGNERFVPGCKHWKPNVVFVAGAIQDGSGWKISYGDNDCACMVASLRESDLNL